MKAALNGALNCSVLDGWWDEAWEDHGEDDIGWAIGQGETYTTSEHDYEDEVESAALFNILEHDIIPTFYDTNHIGLPRRWIARMKASMTHLCSDFNSNRQVRDYTEQSYLPSADRWLSFQGDGRAQAHELAEWKQRIIKEWSSVHLVNVDYDKVDELPVGDSLGVRADIALGTLSPDDVVVQAYHGLIDSAGEIESGESIELTVSEDKGDGVHHYEGEVPAKGTGQHGFAIRILPRHDLLINPYEMGLITWSGSSG
jgi:glycogen phosphorylase